jgi:hypothetical protein
MRNLRLTPEQYMEVNMLNLFFLDSFAQFDVFVQYALDDLQVPPWWCADWPHVWRAIVNKWFELDWEAKHLERRERRLKMAGPAHHQGPINLREFGRRWVRLFISLFRFFVV